jgi:hypothetical protein
MSSPQPEEAPCFGDEDPPNMAPAKHSLHHKKSVFILEKNYNYLQRLFLRLLYLYKDTNVPGVLHKPNNRNLLVSLTLFLKMS